ncbi:uncharacterized protein PV09_04538 [Verruconis gallopava]|uniref:Major facilitator superfamily (MFS) profile domain-containing protein n=1 Tax=Verruconis gallopava TaxID=253628 RepID=A0A0D1YU73_9PEZI|nr:uncharacterized protein PV09_04538 [Verruconis gallopava]KIW04232.1 hypothetical protein PV09_04538 [Verruconis gallopava]
MHGQNAHPEAASHKSADSVGSLISTTSTLRDDGESPRWTESSKETSLDQINEQDPLLMQDSSTVLPPAPVNEEEQRPTQDKHVKPKTAKWKDLPKKDQLALLTIARLAEPLTQTSLQSYMFYQLKSFDPSQPDDMISTQAGILGAAFTAAQFITAIPWGRASDSDMFGRKVVIIIGLLGTMVSALGFGFSRSFASAVLFRVIGGALNGNVGVMRTMISEIIKEKKYQSRAFMLLPMTFNIGVIIGPILGGILSDPVTQYPKLFGKDSIFGGKSGVWWMEKWPYALPNLVSALFLFSSALMLWLGLDETHEVVRHRLDRGRQLGRFLARLILRRRHDTTMYTSVPLTDGTETPDEDVELQSHVEVEQEQLKKRRILPLRRIWTKNVIVTLCAHGSLAFHVGTFNALWFIFLSTPRYDPKHPQPPALKHQSFPIHFNGGLALSPAHIGLALSILGSIGICLQLFIYPSWSGRLGVVRSYRYSLLLFPICYTLAPYLALLPSTSQPPHEATGIVLWVGIITVLTIQVMARTFALPGTTILVNNSCPHPSVLSTYHGIAQSISSAVRTVGPASMSWLYGRGLVWGVVGTGFWGLACAAIINNCVGAFVRDSDGHEIKLEGE